MRLKTLAYTVGLTATIALPWLVASAADMNSGSGTATAMEKAFMRKAADGGMMEVDLGKVAADKGDSQGVKDFGNRMVTDHSKANDQLKEVASKMGLTLPEKVNARHQAMIDKMSGMSGASFDKSYTMAMIKDHKKDISEFETADKNVKNADLKSFIEATIPVMKDHLAMAEKLGKAGQ